MWWPGVVRLALCMSVGAAGRWNNQLRPGNHIHRKSALSSSWRGFQQGQWAKWRAWRASGHIWLVIVYGTRPGPSSARGGGAPADVTVKRRTLHAHSFIGSRLFQSKPSLPATPPAMSSTLHWKRPNSKKLAAIRFNDTHITVCRPTPTPSPAAVFFFSFQNPAAIHHRRSNLLA